MPLRPMMQMGERGRNGLIRADMRDRKKLAVVPAWPINPAVFEKEGK